MANIAIGKGGNTGGPETFFICPYWPEKGIFPYHRQVKGLPGFSSRCKRRMFITTDPYPDRITTVDLYILNANNPTETLSCLW